MNGYHDEPEARRRHELDAFHALVGAEPLTADRYPLGGLLPLDPEGVDARLHAAGLDETEALIVRARLAVAQGRAQGLVEGAGK